MIVALAAFVLGTWAASTRGHAMMEHVRREVAAFTIAALIVVGVLVVLGESWLLIMSTLNFAVAFRLSRIGWRMCWADAHRRIVRVALADRSSPSTVHLSMRNL
jgi:biotin transporter BioY